MVFLTSLNIIIFHWFKTIHCLHINTIFILLIFMWAKAKVKQLCFFLNNFFVSFSFFLSSFLRQTKYHRWNKVWKIRIESVSYHSRHIFQQAWHLKNISLQRKKIKFFLKNTWNVNNLFKKVTRWQRLTYYNLNNLN